MPRLAPQEDSLEAQEVMTRQGTRIGSHMLARIGRMRVVAEAEVLQEGEPA